MIDQRILYDLVATGTVAGRDATRLDYDDALRVVADQAVRYYQHDDLVGEALCYLAEVLLLAAASRPHPVVPF